MVIASKKHDISLTRRGKWIIVGLVVVALAGLLSLSDSRSSVEFPLLLSEEILGAAKQRQQNPEATTKNNRDNNNEADNNDAACSSEALFRNPLDFAKCIRKDESPSCNPEQAENWDEWVGTRYAKYGGKCITPQLMEETGEEWAISGLGSSMESTAEIRKLLEKILADPALDIKTFVDCPCGDWLWMQTVDLSSVQYFGADITKQTIKENTKCFEKPNAHFHTLNWSCDIPPPVDLLMVRDVLFHLSTSTVLDVLGHVNRSGAKYLLTTTFPNATDAPTDEYEVEGSKVGFRQINLYGPPYNFPEPITKTGVELRGRHMALWKLPIPI